ALSAAVDVIERPGSTVYEYFPILRRVLAKLGWPDYRVILQSTLDTLIPYFDRIDDTPLPPPLVRFIKQRGIDSTNALNHVLFHYNNNSTCVHYMQAMATLGTNGVTSSPLVISPGRVSTLASNHEAFKTVEYT